MFNDLFLYAVNDFYLFVDNKFLFTANHAFTDGVFFGLVQQGYQAVFRIEHLTDKPGEADD
jgi:hypothetical protein